MTALDQKFFQGDGDLPEAIRSKVLVADFHDSVSAALKDAGWQGQLVCTAGLRISADGQLVQDARFIMRGPLHTAAIPIKASTIWEGAAKDITLHVTLPDSDAFQFAGGELCSDFLNQALVKFHFTKDTKDTSLPVLPTEWEANKLGQFSLRLMAHLDKASNGKAGPHFRVSVLLFPLSVDQLQELSDATQSSAWPGIRILEGKSELFPRAPPGCWGCPLFPVLNTSLRAADCTAIPGGAHLRFAISELMQTAALPTACKSRAGLRKQMEDMTADPSLCEQLLPTMVWPSAPRPDNNTGSLQRIYRVFEPVVLNHLLGSRWHL